MWSFRFLSLVDPTGLFLSWFLVSPGCRRVSRDLLSEEDARVALPTVARHGFARLVAARHAIWRLRRSGSQPAQDTNDHEHTNHLYVFFSFLSLFVLRFCLLCFHPTRIPGGYQFTPTHSLFLICEFAYIPLQHSLLHILCQYLLHSTSLLSLTQ